MDNVHSMWYNSMWYTFEALWFKEAEIKAYFENSIDIDGAKLTLLEAVDRYLNSLYNRKKLAHNTKVGYNVSITLMLYCLQKQRMV